MSIPSPKLNQTEFGSNCCRVYATELSPRWSRLTSFVAFLLPCHCRIDDLDGHRSEPSRSAFLSGSSAPLMLRMEQSAPKRKEALNGSDLWPFRARVSWLCCQERNEGGEPRPPRRKLRQLNAAAIGCKLSLLSRRRGGRCRARRCWRRCTTARRYRRRQPQRRWPPRRRASRPDSRSDRDPG